VKKGGGSAPDCRFHFGATSWTGDGWLAPNAMEVAPARASELSLIARSRGPAREGLFWFSAEAEASHDHRQSRRDDHSRGLRCRPLRSPGYY
jgi:hypothetical protein